MKETDKDFKRKIYLIKLPISHEKMLKNEVIFDRNSSWEIMQKLWQKLCWSITYAA